MIAVLALATAIAAQSAPVEIGACHVSLNVRHLLGENRFAVTTALSIYDRSPQPVEYASFAIIGLTRSGATARWVGQSIGDRFQAAALGKEIAPGQTVQKSATISTVATAGSPVDRAMKSIASFECGVLEVVPKAGRIWLDPHLLKRVTPQTGQ